MLVALAFIGPLGCADDEWTEPLPKPRSPTADGTDGQTPPSIVMDARPTVAGIECEQVELPAMRQADGTPLPMSVRQALAAPTQALDEAQAQRQPDAIAAAVCSLRQALAEFQGTAESLPSYGSTAVGIALPQTLLESALGTLQNDYFAREPWLGQPTDDGVALTFPLAEPCRWVSWYLMAASLLAEEDTRRQPLLDRARGGLTWLRATQRSDGLFPLPDLADDYQSRLSTCLAGGGTPDDCLRSMPSAYRKAAALRQTWLAAGSPAGLLVGGWWVGDVRAGRDGSLQPDNALCGRTFLRAHALLGDAAFLQAAAAAVSWTKTQGEASDWHTNAASVGLLAHWALLHPGGDEAQQALRKARFGVLPGALADGRWLDQRNANLVQHHILLANLALLDQVVDDPLVSLTMAAANQRAVQEITQRGSASIDDGIAAHIEASRAGFDPAAALDILLHAAATDPAHVGALLEWLVDVS